MISQIRTILTVKKTVKLKALVFRGKFIALFYGLLLPGPFLEGETIIFLVLFFWKGLFL